MIDYKEYAKQMRENSIAINGILQVTEELWLQIADIIDDLAEKQIPKKVTHEATLYRCCTCPTCKNVVEEFTEFMGNRCRVTPTHCKYCGQKLDWRQEDDR